MSDIAKLLEVMRQLRDPDSGCPWDLEQDFSTITATLDTSHQQRLHCGLLTNHGEQAPARGELLLKRGKRRVAG